MLESYSCYFQKFNLMQNEDAAREHDRIGIESGENNVPPRGEPFRRLRVLLVEFSDEIEAHEIPAFRGAIIAKAGREHILFHNHLNEQKYLYRYPLIQYKRIRRHPAIVCLDYGVDQIHNYFENRDWSIHISDRWLEMKIARLQMNQFTIQVWDRDFTYRISNWIALNQENYREYMNLPEGAGRIEYLQRKLTGNILAFAKGINWDVTRPVTVSIQQIEGIRPVTLKGKKVMGFNMVFTCNVFLPNYIGLGKSVSLGYGNVFQINTTNNKE